MEAARTQLAGGLPRPAGSVRKSVRINSVFIVMTLVRDWRARQVAMVYQKAGWETKSKICRRVIFLFNRHRAHMRQSRTGKVKNQFRDKDALRWYKVLAMMPWLCRNFVGIRSYPAIVTFWRGCCWLQLRFEVLLHAGPDVCRGIVRWSAGAELNW